MTLLSYMSENVFRPIFHQMQGYSGITARTADWLELFKKPDDEIVGLRRARLRRVMERAYAEVPYYTDLFNSLGVSKDLNSPEILAALPTLDKLKIREAPDRMLNQSIPRESLHRSMTGGSTSEPLILFRDRDCYMSRWGLQYACNIVSGWRPGDWYGMVWGAHRDLPLGDSLRARTMNQLFHRQIILNASSLGVEGIKNFVAEINRKRPRLIYGYPVMLNIVAQTIEKLELKPPPLEKIIVTAEKLTDIGRENIERAFGCPVIDRYASREFGVIANQITGSNYMQIVPASVIIEIAPSDPADPNFGELIVTDLLNIGMPMIRYRTGDVGRLTYTSVNGSEGWYLSEITGRTTDLLVTKTGKLISGTGVDPFFEEYIGYDQLQIHQLTLGSFIMKVKPNADFDSESERLLKEKLYKVCGQDISITVEFVDEIPRDPSGKHRIVVSHVAPERFMVGS